MKKFLGILLLTQIMVGFSWGTESLDEQLIEALSVAAIRQSQDFEGLPVERIFSERDFTKLVVVLNNLGTFVEKELEVDLTADGFIIESLKAIWDNNQPLGVRVEKVAPTLVTGDTEEEISASVSTVATAPSASKETSPADAARSREAELRAQGASDASVVLKREGRRIEKQISNTLKKWGFK